MNRVQAGVKHDQKSAQDSAGKDTKPTVIPSSRHVSQLCKCILRICNDPFYRNIWNQTRLSPVTAASCVVVQVGALYLSSASTLVYACLHGLTSRVQPSSCHPDYLPGALLAQDQRILVCPQVLLHTTTDTSRLGCELVQTCADLCRLIISHTCLCRMHVLLQTLYMACMLAITVMAILLVSVMLPCGKCTYRVI